MSYVNPGDVLEHRSTGTRYTATSPDRFVRRPGEGWFPVVEARGPGGRETELLLQDVTRVVQTEDSK